jgi:hypothetical protein
MTLENIISLDKDYRKIPFTISKSKHIIVNGRINGSSGRFILDTGASNSCVSVEEEINFNIISIYDGNTATGAGAMGIQTKTSIGNVLCLSYWKTNKAVLISIDLTFVNQALKTHQVKPINGIIGADILIEYKAIIDYQSKNLYLIKKP